MSHINSLKVWFWIMFSD